MYLNRSAEITCPMTALEMKAWRFLEVSFTATWGISATPAMRLLSHKL